MAILPSDRHELTPRALTSSADLRVGRGRPSVRVVSIENQRLAEEYAEGHVVSIARTNVESRNREARERSVAASRKAPRTRRARLATSKAILRRPRRTPHADTPRASRPSTRRAGEP